MTAGSVLSIVSTTSTSGANTAYSILYMVPATATTWNLNMQVIGSTPSTSLSCHGSLGAVHTASNAP
jgi:hypothetical protein